MEMAFLLLPIMVITGPKINNGLSDLLIESIALAGKNLYAGTRSSGVFISSDDG